jgi:hypothetical protein
MALHSIGAYYLLAALLIRIFPDALVTVIFEHVLTVIYLLVSRRASNSYQSDNNSSAAIVAAPFPCFFQI